MVDIYQNEIYYIEKMIKLGIAYTIKINNIGTYVCMNNNDNDNQYRIRVIPIEHKEVSNYKKNKSDYIVWIPGNDEYCHNSPWGNGKPSANLYVIAMFK